MGKRIERFEDLEVWQEGMRLIVDIHNLLKNCRDYSLRDQLHRSSVSIPSNIAEGFERQTNKEFIYCLYVSQSSSGELRNQLYVAMELKLIDREVGAGLADRCRKISSMLYNLIQTRRRNFYEKDTEREEQNTEHRHRNMDLRSTLLSVLRSSVLHVPDSHEYTTSET